MTNLPENLSRKFDTLKSILAGYEKVAIAYSGGVDSSLLLKAACDVLGENATAYFADSIVQTAQERETARSFAEEISAKLVVLKFDLLVFPDFIKNPLDRCYYCKKKIFSEIIEQAAGQGIRVVADGTNLDDLHQFRPGAKAVKELGVKTPLVDAKLTKSDIRSISKSLGLSSWDRHSASCLATRVAPGLEITAQRLAIIEKAEHYLHDKGFFGCRVRLAETFSTVEFSSGDVHRFIAQRLEKDFIAFMQTLGVNKVFLDLQEREYSL